MTGEAPFDVADLASLANLLEVPIEQFFQAPRRSSDGQGMNALYWALPAAA